MPETPLGFVDYPAKNDQNWYSGSDGHETWLSRVELLGIPTYATFSDLPAAGTRPTASGTDGTQRQFAAVAADRTVYRDDGTEWVPWFGKGTSSRPLPNTSHFETISTDEATIGGGPTATRTQSLIHQETQTPNDDDVVFDGLDSSFTQYIIKIRNAVPVFDGRRLLMRVSTDGGATFEAGASAYQYERVNIASGGSLTGDGSSDDKIELTPGTVGNDTGEGLSGQIKIYDPANGDLFQHISAKVSYHAAGDNLQQTRIGAEYLTAEPIDAVQLDFGSNQDIASGEFALYGVLS